MTKKLFYSDAYKTTETAVVTDILNFNGKRAFVLDRTIFFPEGGGRTSDIGFVNDTKIIDVRESDGVIYHIFDGESKIEKGDTVRLEIDFEKRFSDMQNHSGEHICSGLIHNLFSLENKGFHLGKDAVTMDFERVLTADERAKIERLANEIVWKNKKIKTFFPTREEAKNLDFRSKKEISDSLRLVEIEDVDLCACCAPHVKMTGEIGLIKIIGAEKVRGGSRISILCGKRAFEDVSLKNAQNKRISVLLSAKENETFEAVSRVKLEKEKALLSLEEKTFELLKTVVDGKNEEDIQIDFCDFTGESLRKYAVLLSEKARKFSVAFSGDDGEFKFALVSSGSFDEREFLKKMKTRFTVKGGGRNGLVRGSIFATKVELENYILKES